MAKDRSRRPRDERKDDQGEVRASEQHILGNGGEGDAGDVAEWNWSGGGFKGDSDCGCCSWEVRPWNNGQIPNQSKNDAGRWSAFLQIVFTHYDYQSPPPMVPPIPAPPAPAPTIPIPVPQPATPPAILLAQPWWIRCKGECPNGGHCCFRYQVYRINPTTRVLGFRCDCHLKAHTPD